MDLQTALSKVETLVQNGIDKKLFDPTKFIQDVKGAALSEGKTLIAEADQAFQDFEKIVNEMADEISDTLWAMTKETDAEALDLLKQDLELAVPSIAASAKSELYSKVATDATSAMEDIWSFIVKAATIAAKAIIASALTA